MFPVKQRVPREIFKKVMTEGERFSSGLFLLKRLENGLEHGRFGIVVPKKVAKLSVSRHEIKRWICASIKENASIFGNFDYVFSALPKISDQNFQKINEEMKKFRFNENL